MSHFDYKPYYRRNLPHIQPPGATFFVTFHLAGSLPQRILKQWKAEKSLLLKLKNDSSFVASAQVASGQKRKHREWKQQWFQKFEKTLDNAQNGPLWLKDKRVAKEVAESLHYRDGKVYRLDAYCIMANHVHIVFAPLPIEPSGTNTIDSRDNTGQTNSLCYNTLSSTVDSRDNTGQTNSLCYNTLSSTVGSRDNTGQTNSLCYNTLSSTVGSRDNTGQTNSLCYNTLSSTVGSRDNTGQTNSLCYNTLSSTVGSRDNTGQTNSLCYNTLSSTVGSRDNTGQTNSLCYNTLSSTIDSRDNTGQTNSLCYNTLSSIMQSLKGYTAWKANRLLERNGAFWHHESYDHAVRNTSEWQRIITYVLNNPVKAGLVDEWEKWRWSYYRPRLSP